MLKFEACFYRTAKMRLCSTFVLLCSMVFCAGVIPSAKAEIRDYPSVTVLAPRSMTEVMSRLVRIYANQGEITVSAAFANTQHQAEQITAGEPADVIITDSPFVIRTLKNQGLLDVYFINNIAHGQLVIVRSFPDKTLPLLDSSGTLFTSPYQLPSLTTYRKDNALPWSEAEAERSTRTIVDYARSAYRKATLQHYEAERNLLRQRPLILANTQISAAGLSSKEVLDRLQISLNIAALDIVDDTRDVRQKLASNAAVGLMYQADMMQEGFVPHTTLRVDPALYAPPMFQAAVIAGENMEYARAFVEFLVTPEAQNVFTEFGFLPRVLE